MESDQLSRLGTSGTEEEQMRFYWMVAFALAVPAAALGQGLPTAEPESVGMSSEALSKIRPAMARFVGEGRAAGIVTMVARKGRVVHWESVGSRELGSDPLQPDDIFRIYSMTKPITSTAVMILVEEGRLDLDNPISEYLPQFGAPKVYEGERLVPAARPITVRDLLGHTSGLTYGFFGSTHVDSLYSAADLFSAEHDLEELVSRVASLPLVGHPGSEWNYSVSTDILGHLIEVVSGMWFDEFLKERIFRLLEMHDTDFFVSEDRHDRFTAMYTQGVEGLRLSDSPRTGDYSHQPRLLSGGGGLVSTASDYIRFAQMLLNGGELEGVRLLTQETVELMRTNRLPKEHLPLRLGDVWVAPGYGFGLGFSVLVDEEATEEPDNAGIFRWWGSGSTYFWIDPNEHLIGIVLAQVLPPTVPDMEKTFQTLVYESVKKN